jgi:putative ubiquitin-RnfH superfamily antitoxin RatB of RatAB toxin-antitoxin module
MTNVPLVGLAVKIEVVLALPDRQYLVGLSIPEGTTIRQAALASFETGLLPKDCSEINPATAPLGVYGKLEEDSFLLSDGDRVEIYRPLLQDPKEWRRQRANAKKNTQ